ncbi:MAG: hypothetical protein AB7K67_01150 [Hyphomicrobiaceae bacterium]
MTVRRDSTADAAEALAREMRPSPPPPAKRDRAWETLKFAKARDQFAADLDEAVTLIGLLTDARTKPRQRSMAAAVSRRLAARAAQLRGEA